MTHRNPMIFHPKEGRLKVGLSEGPTYLKIWSDLEKKTNWAINKIKKSASIETIIATQIFAAGKVSNSDL